MSAVFCLTCVYGGCDCPRGKGVSTHHTMTSQSLYRYLERQIITSIDVLIKCHNLPTLKPVMAFCRLLVTCTIYMYTELGVTMAPKLSYVYMSSHACKQNPKPSKPHGHQWFGNTTVYHQPTRKRFCWIKAAAYTKVMQLENCDSKFVGYMMYLVHNLKWAEHTMLKTMRQQCIPVPFILEQQKLLHTRNKISCMYIWLSWWTT